MKFCESVYCEKCGFASRIMTAEKAMEGVCSHCKTQGLKVLGY